MLPWSRNIPPISCTSKWRWPMVRRAASRITAKASGSRVPSGFPFWASCFIFWVRAGKSSSFRPFIFGSSSLIRATMGQAFLSSRSFFVPIIFLSVHSIIAPGPSSFCSKAANLKRILPGAMPTGRRPSGKRLPRQARAPKVGGYLWACRDGFEPHLYEELALQGAHPALITRGLVASDSVPQASPAFARTGFLVGKVFESSPVLEFPDLAGTIARSLEGLVRDRALCLQAFTP